MRINKKSLIAALNAVVKVSPPRPSLLSLKNVLIEYKGDKAKFSCTDMSAYMTVEIEASGGGVFVSVPVRLLKQVVGLMPDGEILFDETQGVLKVSSESVVYSINTTDINEFPEPDERARVLTASMACADLKAGLQATTYAISKDEDRLRLTYSLLELGEESSIVATDGFRMAVYKVEAVIQDESRILVPWYHAEVLRQLLPTSERVVISTTAFTVEFEFGSVRFQVAVPDLKFVDWKQILPKNEPVSSIVVSKADLLRAAKLTALEDKYLDIASRGYTVNVNNKTVQVGIPFDNGTPINFDVSMNCGYLSEALSSMLGETVWIEFRGSDRPLMIKSMDDKRMALIMPAFPDRK